MKPVQYPQEVRGNFIAGSFVPANDPHGVLEIRSPAAKEDLIGNFEYSYIDVDQTVEDSRSAFKKWKKTSLDERKKLISKYGEIIKRREAELAEVIARETGKPLWETKTEVAGMVGKVAITLNQSLDLVKDYQIDEILPGTTGSCYYRPLGVMAVVGPFNFPGHLPNGHILPALATGNTVVFKPSEKTPLTGQLMIECFEEAGFPPGVVNLLQGEKEVGRRLCVHKDIAAVLFTGSYEVGNRIKQDTLQQHWKLLALEMGGKNAAIICKDANIDVALREVFLGAYMTTGQRCSATSRVLVHHSIIDSFANRMHKRSKAFKIGHPFDEPFMGPLIDQRSVDRYMKFQGIAQREGYEVIMRGKALEVEGYEGNFVTPSVFRSKDSSVEFAKKSVLQQTEIFAPSVTLIPFDEIEEAIDLANCTQYGLVASIFTESRDNFRACVEDIETGLLNWNRMTPGASSKLPFGGLKKSGNHFPTALTSTHYCTYPLACLESENPSDAAPTQPGIEWE